MAIFNKFLIISQFILTAVNATVTSPSYKIEYGESCSGHWSDITSSDKCEKAAAALNLEWFPGVQNHDKFLPGCSIVDETSKGDEDLKNKVIFNTNPTQYVGLLQLFHNYRQLCFSGNYHKMNFGEFCSGIWSHITTNEECKEAANELGLIYGETDLVENVGISQCFLAEDTIHVWKKWRGKVIFNPKSKSNTSSKPFAPLCSFDDGDCPSGYSSNTGVILHNIKQIETFSKKACGSECDVTTGCESFEYINEFAGPNKCILHKERKPTNKSKGVHMIGRIFCSKVTIVATSSSTYENDKKGYGAHLAVDGDGKTFSKTLEESEPWLLLFLPTRETIHNVTLFINHNEPISGEIWVIEKVRKDEGITNRIHRLCGKFAKPSGYDESSEVVVKCNEPFPADIIKIKVTEAGQHSLKINEVKYDSTAYTRMYKKYQKIPIDYRIELAIYISVGLVAVGLVAVILYIRHMNRRSNAQRALIEKLKNEKLEEDKDKLNPDIPMNYQIDALHYNWQKYEIEKGKFTIGKKIGEGQFGRVSAGTITDLYGPGTGETEVAVKRVKNSLNEEQVDSLLDELKILSNLGSHPNLVNLLGSYTSNLTTKKKICIFLDYCSFGDLKDMLVNNRDKMIGKIKNPEDPNEAQFNKNNLRTWCYQIAKGMEYLESNLIMHGDLAARNVLIDENYVAKIGDFGLSKQMHYQQNYKKINRILIPWAWMAVEYLETGELNIKSDVWSFGVVCWEIFSLGSKPYGIEQFEDVKKKLLEGEHLPVPEYMGELDEKGVIYPQIMEPCWQMSPTARPNFKRIVQIMESSWSTEETENYRKMEKSFNDMQAKLSIARGNEGGEHLNKNVYTKEPHQSNQEHEGYVTLSNQYLPMTGQGIRKPYKDNKKKYPVSKKSKR